MNATVDTSKDSTAQQAVVTSAKDFDLSRWGTSIGPDDSAIWAIAQNMASTSTSNRPGFKSAKVDQAGPKINSVIELNPKIDRSQRRLQCSLRFEAFFDHLAPKADRAVQEHPTIFGQSVPGRFESTPRVITPEKATPAAEASRPML